MPELMAGRRVLITGVRNKWSIAWHAAQAVIREGAKVAFSVYGERELTALTKLLQELGEEAPVFECNMDEDSQVDTLMSKVSDVFEGRLDGMLHAIAFANREDLVGEFAATSRAGFGLAHDRSVYSLVTLARAARPLFQQEGGSIVTLSYLGAERVVPNYNVMGVAKAALESTVRYLAFDLGKENVRVNAVSAGPIKTLAATGISNFDAMIKHVADSAPLRRGIDADEVGDAVMFLLSELARGITGEVLHVDAGYNIVGTL